MSIQKLSTALGAGSTIPTAGRFAQISSGGTRTTYTSGGVTYEVRSFTSSGSLVVQSSGVVDILVIGAGGGGGAGGGAVSVFAGGGGGAGGYLEVTNAFFEAGSHTVVIPAGGAAGTSYGDGKPGQTARCGDFYSVGGGYGGGSSNGPGGFGGSGGAGSGTGISGLGNDAGTNNIYASGGGGGAGSVGGNSASSVGGNGGNGLASSITGTSVTRAGGGGGGTNGNVPGSGGSGGGGAGATNDSAPGTSGTVNTGGGGGGGGRNGSTGAGSSGGAGGSGIVIVRTIIGGSAAGVAASGGTETTYVGDGSNGVAGQTYKVHTFSSSGSFTVTAGGNIDACLVAGGGGAGAGQSGSYGGSGGGAGGMLEVSNFNISPGVYTVTVGAAGANASSGSGLPGYAGGDSSISGNVMLTAVGGGFGDGVARQSPSIGGCGGGSYGIAARGISGQGYAGCNANYIYGGNGGGAGGAAVQGVGTATGSYGAGRTTTISGTSVEYSRGGAGGLQTKPGTGQKGNGGSSEYASNNGFELAQGGQVIIRYPI